MYMYLMNYGNVLQSADLGTQSQTVPSNVLIAVMEKNAKWFATVPRIFVILHQGVHRRKLVINLIFLCNTLPFEIEWNQFIIYFLCRFSNNVSSMSTDIISSSPEAKVRFGFSDNLLFVCLFGFFLSHSRIFNHTETCHSKCGTLKNSHCSMVMSAQHR